MDTPKMNAVEVVICGEIVTLTGVESEEYIQRVGRYIDKKISEIQKEKKVFGINSFIGSLIISVNITDDLFKEIEKNELLQEEISQNADKLDKLQAENLLLARRVQELQQELANARKELDDYMEAFDKQENQNRHLYKIKRS